jgi:hypothetical protein
MTTQTVFETINLTEYTATEDGVVVGVPVLGAKSRNNRVYTTECMQECFSLYEEAPVFIDHSTSGRRSEEKLGLIKNARYCEESQQIRGDLHLLTTHPLYNRIKEDLDRNLNLFGLSHSAEVWGVNEAGQLKINKIEKVNSVDLVSSPATLKSLTESEEVKRADYLETVQEEVALLIKNNVEEALQLFQDRLVSIFEEITKNRLAELSRNPYTNVDNNFEETKNSFQLCADKNNVRKSFLKL